MKHLNDQYYGGNRLKEVGAPIEGTDAANKEYVDAALTNRPAAGKDIRYEPIVPFDYVQLQYLSNAASTRLDTGFALDCDNIEMEITVEAKTGSWYIFQSRENSDERTNGIAGASSGAKIQFGFSGTTIVSGISRTAGRTYTVIAKAKHGNSSIYVKEHETGEEDYKTGTYTFVPDASNLFLWGNAAGNSVASGNKVLRARLWKNDVIVMDYIPAKTTVNDVEITGFYDRVSRTLKTTVVGSVTAGDVVSPTEKAISVVPNVPTKTSELVNDKGYITESDVPQVVHRTINGEILTGDGCDINIHDGLYFPDAAQDYEGNTYGAVVIGNQVWLSENLRTRFFLNGNWIYPGGNNESETIPYYYNNVNSNIPLKERGYLYNLAAVLHDASTSETTPSGVQGIAPVGWHIPCAAECEQLLDYVKDQKRFSEFSEDGSLQYAKSLAARKRWTSTNLPGTIGYNQEDNNATGFSLVPSGAKQAGQIAGEGTIGFLATCSIYNDTGNWVIYGANNADTQLDWYGAYKTDAFAVRCVSDLNPLQFLSWYIEKYGTIQHKVESMRIYRGVWGLQSNNRIEAELDVDDLNNVDLKSRYGVLLILSVTTDIPANGHLTIKGSDVVVGSEIYYGGSRLTSGLIQQGDTCIVMYRYMGGTNLSFLLSNDRWGQMLSALQDTAVTIHSGSGVPDDDIGSDGDIYIQIQS